MPQEAPPEPQYSERFEERGRDDYRERSRYSEEAPASPFDDWNANEAVDPEALGEEDFESDQAFDARPKPPTPPVPATPEAHQTTDSVHSAEAECDESKKCIMGASVLCPDKKSRCAGTGCCPDGSLCPSAPPLLAGTSGCLKGKAYDCTCEGFDAALADGKRLLYVSPGTVATGHFWTEQFGPQAARNGLMDCTGKEFVQLLFRTCIDAFGNDPEIQVVMSTGGKEDALEGMTLPENFLALDVVPQLELLPKCHAFITHGGANSVHEALSFGIPLAVVPIFGDQPINADMVAKSGAGVSYRYPRDTLTVQDLKEVVNKMMRPGRFQDKAQEMKKELAATGGVSKAADVVLETIKKWSSKLGGA